MKNTWTRIIIIAASAALAVVGIVTSAGASTVECTAGTYAGYCGTQADNGTPRLVMDNSRQRAAVNNPVIGWTDSSTDPATDWFQLAYKGDNALGVMFFWAPTGVNVDLCAADPGNGRVVLRVCNGSNFQRWVATQVGSSAFFTWTNRATHRILAAGARGAQLTTVAPPTAPLGTQQWQFAG
jgi:hypothetical protein